MVDNALSISLKEPLDLPSVLLTALYRITGRSTGELRRSIQAGEPVYTASLFGNDHLFVVPRLEQVIDLLHKTGLPFVLHEWVDNAREEISEDTFRNILGETGEDAP